jgi:hypothetical protein
MVERYSVQDSAERLRIAIRSIPEHLHKAAKAFFKNAHDENLGPAYDCPFIDAHWKRKKIKPLLPKEPPEA